MFSSAFDMSIPDVIFIWFKCTNHILNIPQEVWLYFHATWDYKNLVNVSTDAVVTHEWRLYNTSGALAKKEVTVHQSWWKWFVSHLGKRLHQITCHVDHGLHRRLVTWILFCFWIDHSSRQALLSEQLNHENEPPIRLLEHGEAKVMLHGTQAW